MSAWTCRQLPARPRASLRSVLFLSCCCPGLFPGPAELCAVNPDDTGDVLIATARVMTEDLTYWHSSTDAND